MKTLIIGGGLSGLALAERLESDGRDYLLVEARARFGGRIKTERIGGGFFDMGPAWFWPGQPRIAALLERLGVQAFAQYAQGALSFEDENGEVTRNRDFSSMEGALRVEGGLAVVTDGLAERISNKRLNASVAAISLENDRCQVTLTDRETIDADLIVIALPPRLTAELAFTPALPEAALKAMRNVPTWMAGQAKAVAVYKTPFWRAAGLSGDAMSRRGPMVEIHDASPAEGGPYALFGFIGVPAQSRANEQILRQHLQAQLTRLFGPQAAEPMALYVKDWAFDPLTSTEADKAPLYAHPTYGLPSALVDLWDGRLLFSGTEVAPDFGGYIEGALEAAENTYQKLSVSRRTL